LQSWVTDLSIEIEFLQHIKLYVYCISYDIGLEIGNAHIILGKILERETGKKDKEMTVRRNVAYTESRGRI
jgi:hypothetical protein